MATVAGRLLARDPGLARKLGYSDTRSPRRARRRWNDAPLPLRTAGR